MLRLGVPCLFVLALASGAASRAAVAQSLDAVPVNARVRVATMNGAVETGRVQATRRDSLWLQLDRVDSVVAYPVAGLRAYAVSRGTPRGRGARNGALISGALGLVAIGLSVHSDLTTEDDIIIPSTLFVAPAALLLTAVGTGIGALVVNERWGPWDAVRIGMAPGPRRHVALSYRIAF